MNQMMNYEQKNFLFLYIVNGPLARLHSHTCKTLKASPQILNMMMTYDALKTNGEIQPIWVLLVDGRPDENPRHLKNIKTYCQLFQKFNLDYLTVQAYVSGQFKYNPVERGMATLSGKLAGIMLLINHFGTYLNT